MGGAAYPSGGIAAVVRGGLLNPIAGERNIADDPGMGEAVAVLAAGDGEASARSGAIEYSDSRLVHLERIRREELDA